MELIDIQLVATHVVAFLLVLWLLRRYAWGPVLTFLDRRRALIAGEFASIEERRREAAALRSDYEGRLREIDAEARRRYQSAVAEGSAAAAAIKEEAQRERLRRLALTEEELRRLEDSARETLRKRTVDLALQAAERAIAKQLDEAGHRRLIEQALAEIESAPPAGSV